LYTLKRAFFASCLQAKNPSSFQGLTKLHGGSKKK
jgi:hypothetical protein